MKIIFNANLLYKQKNENTEEAIYRLHENVAYINSGKDSCNETGFFLKNSSQIFLQKNLGMMIGAMKNSFMPISWI